MNFGCLKLWLTTSLASRDSVIYDSESCHHYIAAWCMSQRWYICLYRNCLYSRVKFPVDRSSCNIHLIYFEHNNIAILNLFFCSCNSSSICWIASLLTWISHTFATTCFCSPTWFSNRLWARAAKLALQISLLSWVSI